VTTGPTQQAFAQALAADTGLSYQAALAWSTAEVGPLNNLGIMNGSQPASFATPQQGAAAAAQLINTSPYYAGIRASTKGTVQDQLLAIAQSPWHLGPSGLAAAGGIDPYYVKVFSSFGLGSPAAIGGNPTSGTSGGAMTTAPAPDLTTHWTASDLAAGIGRYLAIPEGQRTPKQQQALTTDIGTLVKDTGSPEAAAALISQAMGGPVQGASSSNVQPAGQLLFSPAGQALQLSPTQPGTIATVQSGLPALGNLPSPAANVAAAMNPTPASSSGSLLGGISPTVLLLIGAAVLVLVLVSSEGGAA
jgi:hypothetical protein